MRTEKMAFLSTGHLSLQTRTWLAGLDWNEQGPAGGPLSYGWFSYAHDDNASSDPVAHAPDDEYPADLWACYEFARARGAFYIRFDSDEDVIEGLPTYDDHPALTDVDGRLVPGMVYDIVEDTDGLWYAELPHQDNGDAQGFETAVECIAHLRQRTIRRVVDNLGNALLPSDYAVAA